MEHEWAVSKVNDWAAQGMLTRESIVERLDQRIKNSFAIREEEKPVLREVFASRATSERGGTTIVTQSAFTSLLQTKAGLPSSPTVIEAGKIIYDIIEYLSTIPFPSSPKATTSHPEGLSLDQLTRGLVWALPDRYASIIEESSDSRLRTKADHRRLIFQSLASRAHDQPHDPGQARELALRNAFDVERRSLHDMCSSNHDDDGDEVYHDLLDVLYSTQMIEHPGHSAVPRDSFRSAAKRIVAENDITSLRSVAIPTESFVILLKLLLGLQFTSTEALIEASQLDSAAHSLCAAFCEDGEDALITWPMFDRGLKDVAPYLLDPFYRLLSRTFLGKASTIDVLDASEPPQTPGSILTLPLQSQLVTFLAASAYFGWLFRTSHYAGPNRPTPAALMNAMQAVPDEAIMVLSGTTTKGESCTFGVFSPKPTADGARIQTNITPENAGQERCVLFQLAPVQGVFRGVVDKPGWEVDDESVTFGQGGGMTMVLEDGLRHATVRHQAAPGSDGNTCAYEANSWRGDWTVGFDISEIEIWSECQR